LTFDHLQFENYIEGLYTKCILLLPVLKTFSAYTYLLPVGAF